MSLTSRILIRNVCKYLLTARNMSSQGRTPLYELRIYSIYPKDIKAFIQISTKWMHLRTAKSQLVGFWFSELGGINDAVHIWEYESLSDRARVRKELSEDESWQQNFIAKASPMWLRQDNALLTLKQGTQLNTDVQPGGVYELQSVPSNVQLGQVSEGSSVLGDFRTVYGPVNKAFRLLHHASIDSAVTASQKSLQDVQDGDIHTRLLLPAPWSTLK